MNILDMITMHEGYRQYPYKDTVGKLTIGIGRNLDDVGLSIEEAKVLLDNDVEKVKHGLDNHIPDWRNLSLSRRMVLIDMGFNLGINGLLGFKRMLGCIENKDYEQASREMLDSKWARQVGIRAERLARMMKNDEAP